MRGVFGEDFTEDVYEKIGIRSAEHQRRTELQHVVMRAIGTTKNAKFTEPVHDVPGVTWSGFARLPIAH